MQLVPVATIILDVPTAMPAYRYWNPWADEGARLALGVVEEAVVRRVQAALDGKAVLDVDGDPVPEGHAEMVKLMP
jgi:hypothetical protein